MPPIPKIVQKSLSEFVTSHLSVTFLILEGASFNVNQAIRERLKVFLHILYNTAFPSIAY